MNLTLEHLAKHLPYGVKFCPKGEPSTVIDIDYIYFKRPPKTNRLPVIKVTELGTFNQVKADYTLSEIQLLLYPLGRINEPIIHEGQVITLLSHLTEEEKRSIIYSTIPTDLNRATYGAVRKLLNLHFDIDGLIAAGLAVDVNTLRENPYA